jgi:OMF family outer membrane factor
MQVENAKLQRKIAQQTVETTAEQIQLAQTIYEQTLIQQKQGTASLTDVLLADNALREAQQTYLTAVIDYLKADLELKKLTGNISKKN